MQFLCNGAVNGMFWLSLILTQGADSVKAYLPDGVWYDLLTSQMKGSTGFFVGLPAPLEKIPLHIRGGSIIPVQAVAVTTTLSYVSPCIVWPCSHQFLPCLIISCVGWLLPCRRKNPFGLLVAYGKDGTAEGDLYWDDGEALGMLSVMSASLLCLWTGYWAGFIFTVPDSYSGKKYSQLKFSAKQVSMLFIVALFPHWFFFCTTIR